MASPASRTARAAASGRRWPGYLSIVAVLVAGTAVVPFVSPRHGSLGIVLAALAALVLVSLIALPTPAKDGRLAEQWQDERARALRRDLDAR